MTVFNSLGSNYNLGFALKALFSWNNPKVKIEVEKYLSERYGGKVFLLYKGRDAIRLALELSGLPKGSNVAVTAFTCSAVCKAVADAGCKTVFLDIEGKSLNFSLETLKKVEDIKAVIVQNTFGNPCDFKNIEQYCQKNGILIIDDLAHNAEGFGGDFAALSFSQDKTLDAISGGALIIRNGRFIPKNEISFAKVPFGTQIKDRFYPILTYKIRKTYGLGIGKAFHFFLKKFGLLSQPMPKDDGKIHFLPAWYCSLIKSRFSNLEEELRHRKKIAEIYSEKISKNILAPFSGYLRFPIFVKNRRSLIEFLEKNNVFVSDIWYSLSVSRGRCPVSDKISKEIVNLPTHINISSGQAINLAEKVNLWLRSQ